MFTLGQPELFVPASLHRIQCNLMASTFENLLVFYLGCVKIKCYVRFWGVRKTVTLRTRITGGDVAKHCMHIRALGTA